MNNNYKGFGAWFSGLVKWQFVLQLFERFNTFYDYILLYYTERFNPIQHGAGEGDGGPKGPPHILPVFPL